MNRLLSVVRLIALMMAATVILFSAFGNEQDNALCSTDGITSS